MKMTSLLKPAQRLAYLGCNLASMHGQEEVLAGSGGSCWSGPAWHPAQSHRGSLRPVGIIKALCWLGGFLRAEDLKSF